MNVGEVIGNVLRSRNRFEEERVPDEQLRTEQSREEKGLTLLSQCLRTLYDSDSFMSAIQQVTALTGQYLQAEQSCCFWLKDDVICNSFQWSNGELHIPEIPKEEFGKLYLDLWDSFFDGEEYLIILDTRQPDFVTETLRSRFAAYHIENLIMIPIYYKEQLLQFVIYNNVKKEVPGLAEFVDSLYCMLSMNVCRVFERKRNFELTYYDTLTGLYNRAKFWKDMRDAAEEERKNTGIVLVHMKNLRKTNEAQGHEAGNQMLKRFAAQLDRIMPGEIIYRIGGSEFVLWMQHLEREEFIDKVLSLKEALSEAAKVAARWEEYAEDLYQLARQTDEDLYQELEADDRKNHFRQ
ncbi:MAG: GGDEF domain-containing protein [Lachnospiraceae bacterium]|nr:GGDEF domain-containing protein [Lachnospiraceae bacterium]